MREYQNENSEIFKSKGLKATLGLISRPMVLHSNKFDNSSVYYKSMDLSAVTEAKTSIKLLSLIRKAHY